MRVKMKACAERRQSLDDSWRKSRRHAGRSRSRNPVAIRTERAVGVVGAWVIARVFVRRLKAVAAMARRVQEERFRR